MRDIIRGVCAEEAYAYIIGRPAINCFNCDQVENRVWVVAPHPCGQDAIEALRCFTFYDLDFLRLHRYDLGSLPRTVPTLDSLGTLP